MPEAFAAYIYLQRVHYLVMHWFHSHNRYMVLVMYFMAIFKTGNGESGNGNGEWGMGTGNGNMRGMTGESAGNDRGICGE